MVSNVLANMCLVCSKHFRHNQRALYCSDSQPWVHLCCTCSLSVNEYVSVPQSCEWYCHNCITHVLPFNYLEEIEFMDYIFDKARSDTANYKMIKNVCNITLYQWMKILILKRLLIIRFQANNHACSKSLYDNQFSIIHINARILNKNIGKLQLLINSLCFSFSIIAMKCLESNCFKSLFVYIYIATVFKS